jgi:histidinol-phosphate phosphatase family protein
MKVVLMDRDGTVIETPPDHRVDKVEKVVLRPRALQAMGSLAQQGFNVIFVTNQSGIAEGLIDDKISREVHNRMLELLAPSGINILGTYVCPHKQAGDCACRKPRTQMLLDAAADFDIKLPCTYMVGDRLSDVEAGLNVGAKTIFIQDDDGEINCLEATYIAPDLYQAAQYIISNS